MHNFLAIRGSKETIDRVTEDVVTQSVRNFVVDVQCEVQELSDGYSIVQNLALTHEASLISFDRPSENLLTISVMVRNDSTLVPVGLSMGIASEYDDVTVEHKFHKKNQPFIGGFKIEGRALLDFFCWQSNGEIAHAITQFLLDELYSDGQQKPIPSFCRFLGREQRAGISHDYFEDCYEVIFDKNESVYLRVSLENGDCEPLNPDLTNQGVLSVGDVVWAASESSIVEGLLEDFINKTPTQFYTNKIKGQFSHNIYSQYRKAHHWSS